MIWLFVVFIVLFYGIAVWTGWHLRRSYIESVSILCTKEDVVEVVKERIDYLKRASKQYGVTTTLDDVDWEFVANEMAEDLIQQVEGRK